MEAVIKLFKNTRTHLEWVLLYCGLVLLIVVEAGHFFSPLLHHLLAITWIELSVVFLALVLCFVLKSIAEISLWRSRERSWYFIAVLAPLLLSLYGLTGIKALMYDDEGVRQITEGMQKLETSPSYGAYNIGYLDNPTRQYILAALIPQFFGHSLVAARLAFFYFYFLSYLALLAALAHYFRSAGIFRPWLMASGTACCISLSPTTIMLVRMFDQGITPLAVEMLFLAGVLLLAEKPTPFRLFWCAWAIGYFPETYVSSLAIWPVAFIILTSFLLYRSYRSIALFLILLYGLFSLYAGVTLHDTLQGDMQSTVNYVTLDEQGGPWVRSFVAFLGPRLSVVPPPLALIAISVLYYTVKRGDVRYLALTFWVIALVVASATYRGTYINTAEYQAEVRTTITLPFLAIGAMMVYTENVARLSAFQKFSGLAMKVSIIFLIITALPVTIFYRESLTFIPLPSDYDKAVYAIATLAETQPKAGIHKIYLLPPFFVEGVQNNIYYFAKEGEVIYAPPPKDEHIPGNYVIYYENRVFGGLSGPDPTIVKIKPE